MEYNNSIKAFLELVRTGLWGKNLDLRIDETTDWQEVYRLATEQAVHGLVLAGLEHSDVKPPKMLLLQWIGEVQQIEQRNKTMNLFVAELVEKMRAADIYTVLVKGQGVAQCYERPLWRPSGDVDFLLSEENYKKAKAFLLPLSSGNKEEERYSQHLGMNIGQWYVEIHGTLRTGLAARVDRQVDAVQRGVFYGGNVRPWMVQGSRFKVQGEETAKDVQVFLPAPTEDVFLVFTHFIKHFYKEGMSMRQLCDWCRLLWTYRNEIKVDWLEKYVRKAGLMKEWQAFAALAVEYMGMPAEAMPFINLDNDYLNQKVDKLVEFILGGYSRNKVKDTKQIAKIFPWKALRYAPSIFLNVNWLKIRERLFN